MPATISFQSNETPPLSMRRFSVDEYRKLGELGVLNSEDRVELLEGWIVHKMNQRPIHCFLVGLITDWLLRHLTPGQIVRCQLPISTQRSEPEPDIAVVQGAHADYRHHHPSGRQCVLLIEVADTSLEKDRAKMEIYAAAGVMEYWIVNLVDKQVERYFDQNGNAFRQSEIHSASDTIHWMAGEHQIHLTLSELFSE